jgi:hypothetical protein
MIIKKVELGQKLPYGISYSDYYGLNICLLIPVWRKFDTKYSWQHMAPVATYWTFRLYFLIRFKKGYRPSFVFDKAWVQSQ